MAATSTHGAGLPVQGIDASTHASGVNLGALVPVLLGLSAPVVAVSVLSPGSVAHTRFLFIAMLAALLAVATVMFLLSLVLEGQLADLLVDQENQQLDLVYANAVASRTRTIRFDQITSLRLTVQYDDDGYRSAAPELVLRDGRRELLPIAVNEPEMRAIRQAIGLVT